MPLLAKTMTPRYILIVAAEYDVHADEVIVRLRRLGHIPLRLSLRDFPEAANISVSYKNGALAGSLRTRNHKVALKDIHSVWWRKSKKPTSNPLLNSTESLFTQREINTFLRGLWESIDAYWISPPSAITKAEDKVYQLKRAAEAGFTIPNTLITSDLDEALAFYDECGGRVVYKTLSGPLYHPSINEGSVPDEERQALLTTLLTRQQLIENGEGIRFAPCLFQVYIEKAHELRVTVIDGDVFAAEIDSQRNADSRIDWRCLNSPLRMRRAHLSPAVEERCRSFVRGMGLRFSAMDLIVQPSGDIVFLENNPNGQWMFVEHEVPEMKMIDTFVQKLARGTPN